MTLAVVNSTVFDERAAAARHLKSTLILAIPLVFCPGGEGGGSYFVFNSTFDTTASSTVTGKCEVNPMPT